MDIWWSTLLEEITGQGRINELGRCTANALDGRDAFAPNVGTRIFNVDSNISLEDSNAPGGS